MANQGGIFTKGVFGMTRREEIEKAANEFYKGDEVSTFVVAAQWADKTMIEKCLYWLTTKSPFIDNKDIDKAVVEFKKYLEE